MLHDLKRENSSAQQDLTHWQERIDLAAAFRWTRRYGYHEGIANHFSLAVSDDGAEFLTNPYGRHFARIRASDLLVVGPESASDDIAQQRIHATAWCIHGPIHRRLPHARCLLHTHMKHATVLSCLKDSTMPPIDQSTMRFYERVAIDEGYEGMALSEAEGERLAAQLGDKPVLILGNHGVLVAGATVAQAFDTLYYFEIACETLVTAYATGRELRIASDAVARQTVADWDLFLKDGSERHFDELKTMLDDLEPDYRD